MSEHRRNKTISFNTTDEHDMTLITHAERINKLTGKPRNFSKYVKQLIERDMQGIPQNNVVAFNSADDEIETKEIKEAMASFL